MTHYKLLHPNDYLGAHDLNGQDFTLTIKEVLRDQELIMQGGVKEKKPVLTFEKAKKKLVLNKTNAKAIASLHGADIDNWPGKAITIYPSKTKCGRDTVDCVRVRATVAEPGTN